MGYIYQKVQNRKKIFMDRKLSSKFENKLLSSTLVTWKFGYFHCFLNKSNFPPFFYLIKNKHRYFFSLLENIKNFFRKDYKIHCKILTAYLHRNELYFLFHVDIKRDIFALEKLNTFVPVLISQNFHSKLNSLEA